MEQSVPLKTPTPLFRLLLLLSATTGIVDAASILGMDKVFTANMTGNVVFLAFAVAGAPNFNPMAYIVALGAFMVGAMIAGKFWRLKAPLLLRHALIAAALIESGLLALAGIVALLPMAENAGWRILAMIALTASAMGFRNAVVRQLKIADLTTTVLTLTITGIAADDRSSRNAGSALRVRLSAVGMIFAGACLGALTTLHANVGPTLLLAAAIVLGGTMLCAHHPQMTTLPKQ